MARKTSRPIRPKENPPSREELLERLARTAQERFPNQELRPFQPGQEKMSDVLEEFLDPYIDDAENDDAYRKLIQFGVIAWNAALLEGDAQREAVEKMIEIAPASLRRDLRNILLEMIERKQRHFSDNLRTILDYQLTDMGGQWHLSIVSTPPPEEL